VTKLETSLICVIVIILICVGFAFFFEHRGAVACVNADKAAVASQETREAVKAATDAQTINQEASTHHEALTAAPDPTPALVCVRKYETRPLSSPATPEPPSHAAPQLPKPDSAGFDPGPKLTPIGQAADAQVIELQDYIRRVCLTK
jgi:hypothetical protein